MDDIRRVRIERFSTGVPGLDEVVGGGLPEYSFNLIAGGAGAGKTTLAHQILFANASPERPALYFTVVGESALKMLRYQQQMSYFDPRKIENVIHFANLGEEVLAKGLGAVLESIIKLVEEYNPGLVVVDSFRAVARSARGLPAGEVDLQGFAQRLAMYMTSWQATTFLVGEYSERETQDNAVFTVADGILWLYQAIERNSSVRKLQVMKLRGQEPMPGLHTFRITQNGIHVFPRIPQRATSIERIAPRRRLSTGISGLDEMMGGGILAGDVVLVAGPAGSGKTILGAQFIAEGVKQGERGIIAVFEEYPEEYVARAKSLGLDLGEMAERGDLAIIYLRPLDLSVDETLFEIQSTAARIGARRVVIDSVSGFELALAPTFREDFRESLYRLVGALTGSGVTQLLTIEVTETFGELRLSPQLISFLTDDIILMRYVEMNGDLRKVIAVVKMRASDHSEEMRAYEVSPKGIVVGQFMGEYSGIISGMPFRQPIEGRQAYLLLAPQEKLALETLMRLGEASPEVLAKATGLQRRVAVQILARLETLKFANKTIENGQSVYRSAAQAMEK